MYRVLQVEMRGKRSEVIGMVVHVVIDSALARAAMAAAIMGNDAEPAIEKEQHLRTTSRRRERWDALGVQPACNGPQAWSAACLQLCDHRRDVSRPRVRARLQGLPRHLRAGVSRGCHRTSCRAAWPPRAPPLCGPRSCRPQALPPQPSAEAGSARWRPRLRGDQRIEHRLQPPATR
jgi:hypothetical protein